MNLHKAIVAMRQAAMSAGDMLLAMQPKTQSLPTRKDFLTDADLKSDSMIRETLRTEYPDIPYSSEEEPGKGIRRRKHWRVDPIDGTINFFFGIVDWGVSIALVDEDDQTVAGVLYLPAQKKLFSACIGHDTILTEIVQGTMSKPKVSQNTSLASGCPIWLDWGKKEMDDDHAQVVRILDKLRQHALYPNLRTGSVNNMRAVIEGEIAGFVFPKTDTYDAPAAGLLVRQAGGHVTELDGSPWTPFSTLVVASNGHIHKELLEIIKGA